MRRAWRDGSAGVINVFFEEKLFIVIREYNVGIL